MTIASIGRSLIRHLNSKPIQLQFQLQFRQYSSSSQPIKPIQGSHMWKNSKKRPIKIRPIQLNETEKKICDLLKEVVAEGNLPTTMRIAGGWVRDKLLGLSSGDIDIALDDCMGKPFAEMVNAHLVKQGHKAKAIGVIKMNPDQSKHLETATVQLFDQWVDFVNLRSETYQSDSRIPDKIEFGTAKQDALRRDITINSLFYNINEGKVEDFTEKGLEDLKQGLIRTPLDPFITFDDDPLRCLRVIRFASRYNFDVHEETFKALSSDVSRNGIKNKISRERVGKEVEKMLRDRNAGLAIDYLVHTNLFDVVFQPHPNQQFDSSASSLSEEELFHTKTAAQVAYSIALEIEEAENFFESLGSQFGLKLTLGEEERYHCFLAAALTLYRHYFSLDKKQKNVSSISVIVLESLKLPGKDAKAIETVLSSIDSFQHLVEEFKKRPQLTRKELGQELKKSGELWKVVFILSLANQLAGQKKYETNPNSFTNPNLDPEHLRWRLEPFPDYQHILRAITDYSLIGSWNEKPLVNGKDVAKILGLNPGPAIGQITQELLDWQLENPNATVTDAIRWVESQKNNPLLQNQ